MSIWGGTFDQEDENVAIHRNVLNCVHEAIRKVSSHFEYLENRSCGLDVNWQPVREDLNMHP